MNEEQFSRALQSIGKTCFVRFFDSFSSNTTSREDIIHRLKKETNYTEGSCISRTAHARSIIRMGLAKRALEAVISSSSRQVTAETRAQARKLLSSLNA